MKLSVIFVALVLALIRADLNNAFIIPGSKISRAVTITGPSSSASSSLFAVNLQQEQDRRELISSNYVLNNLGPGDIARLAVLAETLTFQPGEVVISKGEKADAAFLVVSGTFEGVLDMTASDATPTTQETAGGGQESYVFSKGELFGELALLANVKRPFTIQASTNGGEVLKFNKQDMELAVMANPKTQIEILGKLAGKNQYTVYFDDANKRKCLKKCPIFKGIGKDDTDRVVAEMKPRRYLEDEFVFRNGDIGEAIFFVKSGNFERFDSKLNQTVDVVSEGDYFGAYSPLFGGTRRLDVRALGEEAEVWVLNRDDFFDVVQDLPLFEKALDAVKEKYGLRSNWDVLCSLSFSEIKDLARTASLPKKETVSKHSILSTTSAGLFVAAMVSMLSPGFNGWPRLYDQMLFDNVTLTRVTAFLLAVVGVTGVLRLPPKTPKLRRLLFEQGAWLAVFAFLAQDSNLNIGTGEYTFDFTEPLPSVFFALVIGALLVNCMQCFRESIVGSLESRSSILLGGKNRVLEAIGQLGVFVGVLVAIPTQFYLQDKTVLESSILPGVAAANGVYLTTNLILSGFVGFGMLLATLLFEKKLTRNQALVGFVIVFFISGMYDTIVPVIGDVVPIPDPNLKQLYVEEVDLVKDLYMQYHMNEIGLLLVAVTLALSLVELSKSKGSKASSIRER